MKDYSEKELRDSRPTLVDAQSGITFCLDALFADNEHRFEEPIVTGLSFEELLGALLLVEDTQRQKAWQERFEEIEQEVSEANGTESATTALVTAIEDLPSGNDIHKLAAMIDLLYRSIPDLTSAINQLKK